MRSNLQENFYKRLKQLGGVSSANNPSPSLSNSTLIDYQRANDGIALGIVKENHNYFIKTSNSKNEKLGAEDFAYINGVENKYKYQYHSLAEAEKNRNFFIKTLNESSSKKFKVQGLTEGENISKAQVNADSLNAGKAQSEADKAKGGAALKDTASEKAPGEVPAVAAIAVEKEAEKPKVVDATKESNAKPISVEKQTKPKTNDVAKAEKVTSIQEAAKKEEKVSENFGKEESPISSDEPPMPAGEEPAAEPSAEAPSDAAAGAEAGSAEPELDAAAAALDDMGAGAEAPADAETPVDAGADAEEPAMGGDEGVKDIEKLTGKVTQKIRSTDLTPEMSKGFLKSYIAAFADKLSDLDHEDRKELANEILKDKEEDEMGAAPEAGEEGAVAPEASATGGDEEAEIEEAINQHLAEMGIGEDENVENHEDITTTAKPFKKYVAERGYNPEKVEEISLMEMVSLMNNYTNECGEASDAEGMSNYVTQEVSEKMNESGNSLFEDLMKPFGEKIKTNKKAYAAESVIPMNEMFGDEESEEEEEKEEEAGEENGPENSIAVGEEPAGEEGEPEIGGEEEEEEPVEVKKEISIAPAADAIAIGSPVGSSASGDGQKTATVDLKNATVTLTMSEAEVKLRKIVQKKINEALSGKKSPINESKKSALSTMIDELVNEAIQKRREAIEKRLLRK